MNIWDYVLLSIAFSNQDDDGEIDIDDLVEAEERLPAAIGLYRATMAAGRRGWR